MDVSCLCIRREGGREAEGPDRPSVYRNQSSFFAWLRALESIRQWQPHDMAEFPAGRRPWSSRRGGAPTPYIQKLGFPSEGLKKVTKKGPWRQRPGCSGKAGSVGAGLWEGPTQGVPVV